MQRLACKGARTKHAIHYVETSLFRTLRLNVLRKTSADRHVKLLAIHDHEVQLLAVECVLIGLLQGCLKRERVAAVTPWLTAHTRSVVHLPCLF